MKIQIIIIPEKEELSQIKIIRTAFKELLTYLCCRYMTVSFEFLDRED